MVLRNDDVLQIGYASVHQGYHCKGKDMFQLFLDADKPFKEYDFQCTLAVLAEGIDYYPEWVQYIKDNQYRYNVELHGWTHRHYNKLSKEEGLKELKEAKEKVERTFGTKVTTWYCPYGSRRHPDWGQEVCDELGIAFDPIKGKHEVRYWLKRWENKNETFDHTNFHFWHPEQSKAAKKIVCLLSEKNLNNG